MIKNFLDYLRFAFLNLVHRRLRSWLTMVGIFIGIAAVVSLISLGQGLQNAVNEQFSSIGTNRMIVQPGGEFFGPPGSGAGTSKITKHDLDLVKKVSGVESAAGLVLKTGGKIEFNEQTRFAFVMGVPTDSSFKTLGSRFDVVEGRQLKDGEKNKAVVGYNYFSDKNIFGKTMHLGSTISVEGKEFEVVGLRKKLGDPANDVAVILPIEEVWTLYSSKDEYSAFNVEITKGSSVDNVAAAIKKEMRKDRDQKEGNEDFNVQTSQELISSFNTILNVVQAVLIGIAAISLVVGGVGIMNTMYTSVIERTKEIGIMKAIGARNSDIMTIFLIESGLLGMAGGAIGVVIGIGISKTVEFAAQQAFGSPLIRASVPWYLIVGSLVFSFVVGASAGVLPAKQAADLKPVEALRHE